FRQLFVGGQRRRLCRSPNEGTFRAVEPLKPRPARNTPEWKDPECRLGFRVRPEDVAAWPDLRQGNAVVFHSWTASIHSIETLDPDTHVLRFTAGSGWPMGYWEKEQRYYIENVRAALDAPGEWYLDREAGRVLYKPLPGERIEEFVAVAPVAHGLLRLAGDLDSGLCVEHLVFRGIAFHHSTFHLPRDKAHDGQAAAALGAAVETSGTRDCRFEDITVAHVGEYALWFNTGTRDCTLLRGELHDLGAGGVRIGTTSNENDTNACRNNTVENCFIHDGGHIARAGVGVWIGRSSHHTVRRNDICDFDYTGISVGWSWGYAPSSANHNLIELNHIHHLGNGVLSDMGGIYCLGASPGTVLRGNVMHDILAYSYGGWGLYTDEGSSEILMEKNVVWNTKSGGFHQHYGRENVLRHNILAFSREGQVIRSRQEDHVSFTFEKNIVLVDNGLPLGGNWSNGKVRLDGNIYWDVGGLPLDFAGCDFEEWREDMGQDRHSIIEDPLFHDPVNGDFRLRPGSPAMMMMIEPLPSLRMAGLYGPAEWTSRPERVTHRELDPNMKPPSVRPRAAARREIVDGFETAEPGAKPALAQANEAGQATIRVSTDTCRGPGSRSLKFTDADGLEHPWQPHLVYTVNWRRGSVAAAFDVRLHPGARLWHEWRQHEGNGYKVGPEIRFREDGTLTHGETVLMTVPSETWIHVEITCPLGPRAAETGFDLTVTAEGQEPRAFPALALGHREWRQITWVGFVSEATRHSVFYVDNLEFRNTP
ncbi:MAG: right-handed parallel beta-helix repeat-containing protein, partial [Lentisphaeria bacterium]|nr:right-handed parallel beta-helix repeat-containing protein [Lentisphaeria bacterium]